MREPRRQRRERKKAEKHHRNQHRSHGRRRARRRINSAMRKATLTAALTLSAARPGPVEAHARRAASAIEATSTPTLPDLRLPDDTPPTILIEPPRPRLRRSHNSRFDSHIEAAARKHNVDVDLIRAIIQVESGFEPHARSSKGAKGLMQLMPGTAREMGAHNALDPRQNIFAGARYLRFLLDVFDGDVTLAAAAYNAGPTNVVRFRGIPPFPETRDYVERVHDLLGLEAPDLAPRPAMNAFLTLPGIHPVESEALRGPFRSS